MVPRCGTIYDAPGQPWRAAMVWELNTDGRGLERVRGPHHAQFEEHFQQQHKVWGRPAFATGSTTGPRLVYLPRRPDRPDRHRVRAAPGHDRRGLRQGARGTQAAGTLAGRACRATAAARAGGSAAVFQRSDKPVARVVRPSTGIGSAIAAIDDAVIQKMPREQIRGAALAIVDRTRLVYARGYSRGGARLSRACCRPRCSAWPASPSCRSSLALYQAISEGLLAARVEAARRHPAHQSGRLGADQHGLSTTARSGISCNIGGLFERYQEPRPGGAGGVQHRTSRSPHEQIARYMLTVPIRTAPNDRLDDFGYFLAGEIVRRLRNKSTVESALADRLLKPLQITRLRIARSLLVAPEARRGALSPAQSRHGPERHVQQPAARAGGLRRRALRGDRGSGGLSGAVVDVARILAAMNARPYTPLGRCRSRAS